jgi:hypothetical protein
VPQLLLRGVRGHLGIFVLVCWHAWTCCGVGPGGARLSCSPRPGDLLVVGCSLHVLRLHSAGSAANLLIPFVAGGGCQGRLRRHPGHAGDRSAGACSRRLRDARRPQSVQSGRRQPFARRSLRRSAAGWPRTASAAPEFGRLELPAGWGWLHDAGAVVAVCQCPRRVCGAVSSRRVAHTACGC